MSSDTDRGSLAPPLAILGAVIAVLALLLPWFTMDPAGVASFFRDFQARLGEPSVLTDGQMQATIATAMGDTKHVHAHISGYRVFSPGYSIAVVVLGIRIVMVAAQTSAGRREPASLAPTLAVFGAGLLVFPIYALKNQPGGALSLPDMPEFDGIEMNIFSQSFGLYVCLLGGGLVLASAAMAFLSRTRAPAPVTNGGDAAVVAGAPALARSQGAFVPYGAGAQPTVSTPVPYGAVATPVAPASPLGAAPRLPGPQSPTGPAAPATYAPTQRSSSVPPPA